jgi:hypothetical protein
LISRKKKPLLFSSSLLSWKFATAFLFFVGVALTIARAAFSFVLVFADDALRMPSSAYEFITTSTSISDIPLLT